MKVLIISHGHPKFSAGGGEVAAYAMFKALKDAGNEAYFLAWNNTPGAGEMGRPIEQITSDEWLIATKTDFFTFSSTNEEAINAYRILLESLKPDVIHFHHYIHLGIEFPRLAKLVLKKVKIFLTIHEYLLICANNGQMITPSGELCYGSSPEACNKCFPKITPESFFMREGYLKNCISAVDHFFSPSEFLRGRLISWGIPHDRISYLENILDIPVTTNKKISVETIKNFGFFGQINYYKGLDILLDAFLLLKNSSPQVKLFINGNISEINTPEYRNAIEQKIHELGSSVIFNGPYDKDAIKSRLEQVGWLVMSSRWWENSPVVIREAWANKVPVVLPDIGGMAEKNIDKKLIYLARNVEDLARALTGLSSISLHEYKEIIRKIPKLNDPALFKRLMGFYQ